MTKRRGPYSDPRQGHILQQIDDAYAAHNVDTLSASILMEWCYGAPAIRRLMVSRNGKSVRWPYQTLKRALLKVAIPVGRSPKGKGGPMLWRLDPEKAAQYGWRKREKRMTGKAPPAVL